jgi:epimerase transport system membrane fusion protein
METSITSTSVTQGRTLVKWGLVIVIGGLVPMGAWMALAPMSMAVVAPAFVKVDLNRRPVQHLEGGIVRRVLVRDGQRVSAGQPILILGDVGVDADSNRLAYRVQVEKAVMARLTGEQQGVKQLAFPPELTEAAQQDARIARALDNETSLFVARTGSLDSEIALMLTQRRHVQEESVALRAQIGQVRRSLELQRKDLELNRKLQREGFLSPARVSQIDAAVSDYAARLEERRAEMARLGQRLADIDLKVRSVRNAFTQAANDQLQASMTRLAEAEQEMRKTQDAASRQAVLAPSSGEIIDLKFTSPGAIIRPGDSIAEIVPADPHLILEAHIPTGEINHLHMGQRTRIQFAALRYRGGAMVEGNVAYIPADRFVDRASGESFYNVLVEVDAQGLHSFRELKLMAGMPATVYIEGSKQTALQYLMEPITAGMRKAAREL